MNLQRMSSLACIILHYFKNIITMNDPMRTPKSNRSNDVRSPLQNYKVIFSILKPSNKAQSIQRENKRKLKLVNPKETSQQVSHQASQHTSKEKNKCQPFQSNTTKHQKTLSNSITNDALISTDRQDLRIDLKTFQKVTIDSVKTEQTVENKILFHSQRRGERCSPETIRLTSRCLQIQDIILTAPYFNGKDVSRTANKIIKLKRPSK